jgi:hypothetical protein
VWHLRFRGHVVRVTHLFRNLSLIGEHFGQTVYLCRHKHIATVDADA